jgi:hypothetical protein
MQQQYQHIRHQIQDGDVLLFRRNPSSIISRFICWWTKQPYSHAGVAVWLVLNGTRRLFVAEAAWPLVRVYPMSCYLRDKGEHIDWHSLWDRNKAELLAEFMLQQVGKRYASFLQMLYSFLPGLPKRGRPINPDRVFCSDLVAEGLSTLGYHLPKPPILTTPGDLEYYRCWQGKGEITPDGVG